MQVCRVLMPADLAADSGCLKRYIDCSSSGWARPSARASSASRGWRETRSKTGSRSCSAWPILFSAAARLVGRLLLEEEADGAARLPEVAIARMALVAGREDRARRARIEGRHQLGRACLQGVAVGRRQEVRQHQEAVARIGRRDRAVHSTIRSITTGLRRRAARRCGSPGAPRDRLVGVGLARGMDDAERAAGTDPGADIDDLGEADRGSIASSAWLRPPPSPTTAMPTSRAFMPTTWPGRSAVHGLITGACAR